MQTNMYRNPDSGGWIVEYRHEGDKGWTRVGIYSDRSEAEAAYAKLNRETSYSDLMERYQLDRNYGMSRD